MMSAHIVRLYLAPSSTVIVIAQVGCLFAPIPAKSSPSLIAHRPRCRTADCEVIPRCEGKLCSLTLHLLMYGHEHENENEKATGRSRSGACVSCRRGIARGTRQIEAAAT